MLLAAITMANQNSSDHWTVLPITEGTKLVGQCSRECPYDAKTFWRPTPSQVAVVEQRLPALLHVSGHKLDVSKSYRQYLGLIRAGKKLIYVNAFDSSTMADFTKTWRKEALIICDGGDVFWGVEFDPSTGTFQHLAFNGAI
jgi:hypothetical protein